MSKFAFLSVVYLAATAVSGQLHELKRSTMTSPQTIAASHAEVRKCPSEEATGMARMQAAKNAQIAVCAAFTVLNRADANGFICSIVPRRSEVA